MDATWVRSAHACAVPNPQRVLSQTTSQPMTTNSTRVGVHNALLPLLSNLKTKRGFRSICRDNATPIQHPINQGRANRGYGWYKGVERLIPANHASEVHTPAFLNSDHFLISKEA